jgi:hypothetical protein
MKTPTIVRRVASLVSLPCLLLLVFPAGSEAAMRHTIGFQVTIPDSCGGMPGVVGNPTESSTVDSGTVAPSLVGTTQIGLPIGVRLPILALSSTVGLTGVLEVEDGTNLDLLLLDPLGHVLKTSATTRPTEVVRWTPVVPGLYAFLIVNRSLAVSPYVAYSVITDSMSSSSASSSTSVSSVSSGPSGEPRSITVDQTVDCDGPGVTRKGGWHGVRDDRASGGEYCRNVGAKKANAPAFLEFQFTGSAVDMYILRGPRGGNAEVFIDGASQGRVGFFRPPSDPGHPDNSGKRDLTFGDFVRFVTTPGTPHTFRLDVLNDAPEPDSSLRDMVYIDGFVIRCEVPTAVGALGPGDTGLKVSVHYRNSPSGPVELAITTRESGRLKVDLFDVSGRLVRTVLDEPFAPAGSRTLPLDGPGADGRAPSSSVYFYRVLSREQSASSSVLFLK